MAKLTPKARQALPKADFGIPSKAPGPGSYPVPDKIHAVQAKARATQQVAKGNLSPAAKAQIDAMANKKLGPMPKPPMPKGAAKPAMPQNRGGKK